MSKVFVSFEVTISQSKEHPLIVATPDYVFSGEFDKDVDKSLSDLCHLEYKVQCLVKVFNDLGCQVVALRKETSHLNID